MSTHQSFAADVASMPGGSKELQSRLDTKKCHFNLTVNAPCDHALYRLILFFTHTK